MVRDTGVQFGFSLNSSKMRLCKNDVQNNNGREHITINGDEKIYKFK